MNLKISLLMLGIIIILPVPRVYSALSPHPLEIYEKGTDRLSAYRGEEALLNEAEDHFIDIIQKFPDSALGYLGLSRLYRIRAYLFEDHYDMPRIRKEALPFALKALELGPSLREVHENYARFERIFETFQKQQELAREYLNVSPDSAQTYYAVANLMRDQGEFDKAIEFYKESLQLSPTVLLKQKIFKRIAHVYLTNLNQPEKAAIYYQEALKLNEDDPVLNEYLGIAYFNMQEHKMAVEKFNKAILVLPTKESEYYLLQSQAFILEKEGKVKDAIDFLKRAEQYNSHNSALHYALGNLYYQAEQYEDAYSHFRKVIDLNPGNSNAYYFAGRSADSLGQKHMARDYYQKYLQMNSVGQEADWIRSNVLNSTSSSQP